MSMVGIDDRGAVRHLVLERAEKRNAINAEMVGELGAAFRSAADDDSVRCIVIRGTGPVFSAGMDFATLAGLAAEPHRLHEFRAGVLSAWNLLEEMAKPTIAQIHGACLGGALEMALACDMRVVAADAMLGLPETRFGLVPDVGGCSRLPALVGVGRAKELIMTSRTIDGTEAERIGLANRVAAADQLDEATAALVAELEGCSAVAIGEAKRLLDAAAKPALAQTLDLEVAAQERCVRSGVLAAATAGNG